MKQYVCIILILVLTILMTTSAYATNEDEIYLSKLSAEECIEFIKSYGVKIPDKFEDEMAWAPFVHDIIVQVEENPNTTFSFNYSVLHYFANDIKRAVNIYYGADEENLQSRVMVSAPLQNNTPYGSWLSEYENYNCYAYAIGEKDWIDPGVFDWVDKGNESDTYEYNDQANINTIADLVEADLVAKDYTVTCVSPTMPSTSVTAHTNLICVRKDVDGYYYQYGNYFTWLYDYHFMKLCEDGNWYHKPGGTNPLQYLFIPSNEDTWVGEWCIGIQTYRDTELTYDSEIYFIEYTTPHTYDFIYSDPNQHYYGCTICGEVIESAESCNYVYAFIGTVNGVNKHTCYCQVCGHIQLEEAVCMYKNGDTCILCGVSREVIMEPSSSAPSTTEWF